MKTKVCFIAAGDTKLP